MNWVSSGIRKVSRLNLSPPAQCWNANTYISTGGFWLIGFLNSFVLLLQLLSKPTRASPRHTIRNDGNYRMAISKLINNNLCALTESSSFRESDANHLQDFSPVLAGFLLSSCVSAWRRSERSRVGLLQVFFIQQSVRIHQVLHGDMSTSL